MTSYCFKVKGQRSGGRRQRGLKITSLALSPVVVTVWDMLVTSGESGVETVWYLVYTRRRRAHGGK